MHFLDNPKQRYPFQKKPVFTVESLDRSRGAGGAYEYPGQPPDRAVPTLDHGNACRERVRRRELTDELHETWLEVEQRGLKETPEYRNVLSRADAHARWLAGLVRLAAPPVSSSETEHSYPLDAPQKAA